MVYRELLKDDFERLPAPLRRFHSSARGRARGLIFVRHRNRALARLLGFPAAGENIAADLEVTATDRGEIWTRRFGNHVMRSLQRCERGLLVETMGPIRLQFRVTADAAGLSLKSEGVRYLGVPVPIQLRATERGCGSGWEFAVDVPHVASYGGAMELLP
ncbi:MAG TPA: hypothetical protein VGF59_27705 [Bryobacteraceae bacterium]